MTYINKNQIRTLIIAVIFLSIALVSSVLIRTEITYKDAHSNEPIDICTNKKMNWGQDEYLITKLDSENSIVLKIEEKNKNAWHILLRELDSAYKEFDTCKKGVVRYPLAVENSKIHATEMKDKSKGLVASIGIQNSSSYTPIETFTLNVELLASLYTDDSYNLDSALKDLAHSYKLLRYPDGSIRLSYFGRIGQNPSHFHDFFYEFVYLNDEQLNGTNTIDFISTDNGNTWKTEIITISE